ncbi:MAG: bifunctional diaminohydroxyphosphoribosylaminopyrimidine deaminase/5-amino-6-(5-phosphoribosylamino)uracil reductase RibD [Candidatus Omnitrophica bacterium]|nr:bifunctional diaminohydroxyphosphoribosylaminopyrimidine deaminase/5-amino-6-(5-phosphoribosylamino)uracil reductase RibD [Candidatus Omnitrophota bacterium]
MMKASTNQSSIRGLSRNEAWMKQALERAWQGRFRVSPNPLVGACLVRNHRLITEGFHAEYGADHAEVVALKKAGKKTLGATLYVTLEPCSTWGKTPPCIQAILDAGIREVVIGALDPNPLHHGKGIAALRKAGVKVSFGILAEEVKKQNEYFFKYARTGLPFVTLKMAQSLDGKIATREKKSRWITGKTARNFVHALRAEQDAILVGRNTLLTDDPRLIPVGFEKKCRPEKPWRVVLDPRLEAPVSAKVFNEGPLTIRVISEKILLQKRGKKDPLRGTLLPVPETKSGRLDLKILLKKLGTLGIAKLLVEGGGELAWSLLEARLVDQLIWITAPKIIGGRSAVTSVEGSGFSDPNQALNLNIVRSEPLGEDWLFVAKPK